MARSFSGAVPPPDTVVRILTSATRAPRAGNTDGWDAVVLQGQQTEAFWQATTDEQWRASSRRWQGLRRAPVVVALFTEPAAYLRRYAEKDKASSALGEHPGSWPIPYWFVDAGFAALLLLLGAHNEGLGACFLGNFRGEDALCDALGVPDGRRYVGAVLMGERGGNDPPSPSLSRPRRSATSVLHWGGW